MPTAVAAKLASAIGGAFDTCLGSLSAEVRADPRAASADLVAVEGAVGRLLEVLKTHSSMGARSLERELSRLAYPIAKLRAFVDGGAGALDHQATEILAEHVELRLSEIRVEAEELDEAADGAGARRCA